MDADSAVTWAELAADRDELEKAASRLEFIRASSDFDDIVGEAVLGCLERESRGQSVKVKPPVAAKGAIVDAARKVLGRGGGSNSSHVFDHDIDRAPSWDEEDDETEAQIKEWNSLKWAEKLMRADEGRRCTGTSLSPMTASFAPILVSLPASAVSLQNIQSIATPDEGSTLVLGNYVGPEDGILLVRTGVKGRNPTSATFAGIPLETVEALYLPYEFETSVAMYTLPVLAGDSGDVVLSYASSGTDHRGMTVATMEGVEGLEAVSTEFAEGPNLAATTIDTGQTGSLVVSAFATHSRGIPEEWGAGHVLDGYPTQPEVVYHQMKFLAGSIEAGAPGPYTLGFQNTRPDGYQDFGLIVASFTAAPEPGFGVALAVGAFALCLLTRKGL